MDRQYTSSEVIKILTDYRDSLDDTDRAWYFSQKDLFTNALDDLKELFNPTSVFKRGDKVEGWDGINKKWYSGIYWEYVEDCIRPHLIKETYEDGTIISDYNEIRKPQN